MFCRPNNILPAIVHPTKCCVNNSFSTNVVPHIHPSHTTNVQHTKYDHVHYYPHTESNVNEVTHQHFNGGPRPPFGATGPGFGAGPGFGPGYGQGPGPGFGPGYGQGPGFRR